jgi:anti-sigma B factor antagonist
VRGREEAVPRKPYSIWQAPGQPTVLTLPVVIDIANRGPVTVALEHALRTRATVVVADLTDTKFCDGTGLRALLNAHCCAAAAGRRLRVAAAAPQVRRMLTLPGAGPALVLYPDLATAVAGHHAPASKVLASARRRLRLMPGQAAASRRRQQPRGRPAIPTGHEATEGGWRRR